MMKVQILPPARAMINGCELFLEDAGNVGPAEDRSWLLKNFTEGDGVVSADAVVREVGKGFRRRGGIWCEVQRDLLRFSGLKSRPVRVGVHDGGRTPYFYFDRAMVREWLDAGGRAWIIAELEARSGKRVIPFPGGRRP